MHRHGNNQHLSYDGSFYEGSDEVRDDDGKTDHGREKQQHVVVAGLMY